MPKEKQIVPGRLQNFVVEFEIFGFILIILKLAHDFFT